MSNDSCAARLSEVPDGLHVVRDCRAPGLALIFQSNVRTVEIDVKGHPSGQSAWRFWAQRGGAL